VPVYELPDEVIVSLYLLFLFQLMVCFKKIHVYGCWMRKHVCQNFIGKTYLLAALISFVHSNFSVYFFNIYSQFSTTIHIPRVGKRSKFWDWVHESPNANCL